MRRLLLVAAAMMAVSFALIPAAYAGRDHEWGYDHRWDDERGRDWHRRHDWRDHREARERAYRQGFARGWDERREYEARRFYPAPFPARPPENHFYFRFGPPR